MNFSICIAQQGFTVGDLEGNTRKIIDAARQADARGTRMLLTPELAICGYPAEDLMLRPSFQQACDEALENIVQASREWPRLTLVVGHPQAVEGSRLRRNAASVICSGVSIDSYAKQCIPNDGVFDEQRYFIPGRSACVVEVEGLSMGLLICEDAWDCAPAAAAQEAGARMRLVLNASPFHAGKQRQREHVLAQRAVETGLPLVYAHMVGGQDELVFDGTSMAVQSDGSVSMRAPSFDEALAEVYVEADETTVTLHGSVAARCSDEEEIWHALVLALRDYVGKTRFPGVLLGLSGGIDSALVLAIAVDAIGADRVHTVMMPSSYTADISLHDAREMANRLGVRHDVIGIEKQFTAFRQALEPHFAGLAEDATEENLQARCRGTLLMALSNKFGRLLLTTGNKSELAIGYCTLYGDMAGGFAVIKDVFKTRVFDLAHWRNANDPYGTGHQPIPERIITRPPSAELRPDQKDEDSVLPYPGLDDILAHYMENDETMDSIIQAGHDGAQVEGVVRLIRLNEYKRRQTPVGPRVSQRGFGKDWRMPITNAFRF